MDFYDLEITLINSSVCKFEHCSIIECLELINRFILADKKIKNVSIKKEVLIND